MEIVYGSSNNTVGGTAAGAGNTIAFNGGAGVVVGSNSGDQAVGNAILSNSIYGNGALGIDLGDDGVTLNTPGGPHSGPNDLQNFPVLSQAATFDGNTYVIGTLNSTPGTTFTLQFFANASPDPSGYGQGQTLIGTTTVTTDANGNASFVASFPGVIPAGQAISATATDPSGDTSEFAQDVTVVATTSPVVAVNDTYNIDENSTLTVPAPGVLAQRLRPDRRDPLGGPGHDDLGRVTVVPVGRGVHLHARRRLRRHRYLHLLRHRWDVSVERGHGHDQRESEDRTP